MQRTIRALSDRQLRGLIDDLNERQLAVGMDGLQHQNLLVAEVERRAQVAQGSSSHIVLDPLDQVEVFKPTLRPRMQPARTQRIDPATELWDQEPAAAPPPSAQQAQPTARKSCGISEFKLVKVCPDGAVRELGSLQRDGSLEPIQLIAPCGDDQDPAEALLRMTLEAPVGACSKSAHPLFTITREGPDPDGLERTVHSVSTFDSTRTHELRLLAPGYRTRRELLKPDAATCAREKRLRWWLGDHWLERLEPSRYTISAQACGEDGTASEIRASCEVYPDDWYDFELKLPEVLKLSKKRKWDQSYLELYQGKQTPPPEWEGSPSVAGETIDGLEETVDAESELDPESWDIVAAKHINDTHEKVEQRIRPTLTRNGKPVRLAVDRARDLLSHFKRLVDIAVSKSFDLATFMTSFGGLLPQAGFALEGEAKAMSGVYTASWGWRELSDRRCGYAYRWSPQVTVAACDIGLTAYVKIDGLSGALKDLRGMLKASGAQGKLAEFDSAVHDLRCAIKASMRLKGATPALGKPETDSRDLVGKHPPKQRAENHRVVDPAVTPPPSPPSDQPEAAAGPKIWKEAITFSFEAAANAGDTDRFQVRFYNQTPIDVWYQPPGTGFFGWLFMKLGFKYDHIGVYGSYKLDGETLYLGKGNEAYNAWVMKRIEGKKKVGKVVKTKVARRSPGGDDDEEATEYQEDAAPLSSEEAAPPHEALIRLKTGNKNDEDNHPGLIDSYVLQPVKKAVNKIWNWKWGRNEP